MIERKIVIGFITSQEYYKRIQDKFNITLIESLVAKQIILWCIKHYEEYNAAPGKSIETIFEKNKKSISKELVLEIEEDILPSLSEEFVDEGFDLEFLVKESLKYFSKRDLELYKQKLEFLLDKDKLEEAETLVSEYKPTSVTNTKLSDYILSVSQIRELNRKTPQMLLSPWLRAGQTTIIYGNYGCGKSLLTILVSYLLGCRNHDSKDCEIQKWQVKNPTGCLYIDGELGELEMEERIKQFEWLGDQFVKYQIKVLSVPEYQMATEDTFYLGVRKNQLKIIEWLKENPNYKLIVLDSASTLFGLEEENDNSEWNKKINPFLRDLRALGVACIMLHHAGKANKKGLRGASAMGAMAHNIYQLTPHSDKNIDSGEAWFVITKDKQRASGILFRSFGMHFFQTDDKKETHWEITSCD